MSTSTTGVQYVFKIFKMAHSKHAGFPIQRFIANASIVVNQIFVYQKIVETRLDLRVLDSLFTLLIFHDYTARIYT